MAARTNRSVWIVCHYTGEKGTRFLLAKRSRKANAGGQWNFFGGGVDEGEQPYLSAVRELQEEAGIKAPKQNLNMVASYKAPNGKILMFFSYPMTKPIKPKLNAESSAAKWLSLTKIMALKLHPPTEWFFFNALDKLNREST